VETKAYVFSGLASALATLTDTEKELGVVVVDVGGGKTDICVYVEGALSYSSSIPLGARHVTNDIAVGLRISLESAEKIKLLLNEEKIKKKLKEDKQDDVDITHLNLPEGLKSFSYKTVVEGIIRPRTEEMFDKVLEEIDKSGFINQVPSGLVITGGGALTIGAVEGAKRAIGMPARVGRPQYVTGLVDEIMYPQYASLVGLLLYARDSDTGEKKLNFKDFDKIFRNLSIKGSLRKVTDLIKSFVP
ncbi:cell division protein FtsA, partial [Candidatus Roizmanbacteria bacterium RIFCSPHIGHO2_12_FULL_44_10]